MAIVYPQAWIVVKLLLDDLGQAEASKPVPFQGPPISFKVDRNSFEEADSFEVAFDFEDFPFDPRVIRGGTVEIYLANAEGVQPGFFELQTPLALREEFAIFAGVIDEAKTVFDDEARRTEVKGRDYTAYFLDAEAEAGAIAYREGGVNFSLPEILDKLIAQRPTTKAITVDARDGAELVFPADYMGISKDKPNGARRKRQGENIWEIVQELALNAGYVVYVDLDQVVVRKPSTIYEGFIDPTRVLHWTLGRDVLSYTPSRELGRRHGIQVQVASWDRAKGKTLIAFAADGPKGTIAGPTKESVFIAPTRQVAAAEVGKDAPEPAPPKEPTVRGYVIRGVTDQAQLETVAKQLHETLRHYELVGTLKTAAMVDSEGVAVQRIRYGDPILVDVDADLLSSLAEQPGAEIRRLAQLGWKKADAKKLFEASTRLATPLYVDRATYTFDTSDDTGFSLEIAVRSRRQVELKEGTIL